MVHSPANIAKIQNSQRQVTPAVLMYPPTMGPNDGPANGATANNPTALPRVAGSQLKEFGRIPLCSGQYN